LIGVETVARRLAAIPLNGSRFDPPEDLRLACRKRLDAKGRNATGSYERMRLDEPAPTMRTRRTTPACGSFVHPIEDRGITLREAAALQIFPATYRFSGNYGNIERQIGNAVPVLMARALGDVVAAIVDNAPLAARTAATIDRADSSGSSCSQTLTTAQPAAQSNSSVSVSRSRLRASFASQ
jgi:DNA (cytosine-5)-methyltransferase 1